MPAPSVPVMPSGYGPSIADFNGWVQTPFTFLAARPGLIVRPFGTQSIPSSTMTTLQLAQVDYDPYGGWVTTGSAPNYRWVVPVSGWYDVTVNGWLAAAAGTQLLDVAVNVNGTAWELSTPWLVTADTAGGAVGSQLVYASAGQYLQAQIFHSNGTALLTSGTFGQAASFSATWISS